MTAGYQAVTNRFELPRERGLLEKVLEDMRRGNVDHVLVGNRRGVEVWRRGSVRGGHVGAGLEEVVGARPRVGMEWTMPTESRRYSRLKACATRTGGCS